MLNEQLRKLFEEWKEHPSNADGIFIPDGLVEESQWNKAPLKLMVLLKEANSKDTGWTYQDFIRDKGYEKESATWPNLIRWTYGLLHRFPSYEEVSNNYYSIKEQASSFFKNIYFANIKKTAGESVADDKMIDQYAIETAPLLIEQIRILKPQVVLCCGDVVFQSVKKAFRHHTIEFEKGSSPGGLEYIWWGVNRTRIVRYYNPNAYFPREMTYTYLMNEMRGLL